MFQYFQLQKENKLTYLKEKEKPKKSLYCIRRKSHNYDKYEVQKANALQYVYIIHTVK